MGDKGEQLGIMPLFQALETARKQNLDLVEVAPTAEPPVCRLMDYGKFKYERAKKERDQKKGHRVSVLGEVRLRPKIDIHDFDSKVRSVHKFLEGGDKVKVTIMFRGREIVHPDLGMKLLQKVAESSQEMASLDGRPSMEGKRLHMILSPSSKKNKGTGEKKEPQNAEN